MPIEKTAHYIRVRVADPKRFVRFAIKTLGKGIKAVFGFPKKGGSQIQSLLFPRSRYTLKEALAWVKSHGFEVHETFLVYDVNIEFISQPSQIEKWFVEEVVKEEPEERLVNDEKTKWLIQLLEGGKSEGND